MPDGVLINGKGPYRYNDTLVPDGIEYETINVEPGTFFCNLKFKHTVKNLVTYVNQDGQLFVLVYPTSYWRLKNIKLPMLVSYLIPSGWTII